MIGNIVKTVIGLFAGGVSYFIYKNGVTQLKAAGVPEGAPEYFLLYLTALLPALVTLMMILALIKSALIKYMMPLILINGIAIFWLKSNLGL